MCNMFGYTIMDKDKEIMRVTWGDKPGYAYTENLCGYRHIDIPRYMYSKDGVIDFSYAIDFLETRIVPRTREGIEDILKVYGVREYDPLNMCKKSHGVSMSDFTWVRFLGEDLSYEDVRVR